SRSAASRACGLSRLLRVTDKGALLVDCLTIFDRQVAELSSLTGDFLVVRATDVVRDGGTQSPGPRVVTDLVPGRGPLGGLHAALLEARGDTVFVIACDMPYVTAPFIAYLFSLAGEVDIVVPETDRKC